MPDTKQKTKHEKKKKLPAAILGGFFVAGVGLTVTNALLHENERKDENLLSNKLRIYKDFHNKGQMIVPLDPKLAGRKAQAVFETEKGDKFFIEATIDEKGVATFDHSLLPEGSEYVLKKLQDPVSETNLVDVDSIPVKDRTIDKTFNYDDKGNLEFVRNLGPSNANKEVEVTIKNSKGKENKIKVVADENGIVRVKPTDDPEFASKPTDSYTIASFKDPNGEKLDKEKPSSAMFPIPNKPVLTYDKDKKNDLSKYQLSKETPHDPDSKLLVNYKDKNNEIQTIEIPIKADGTLDEEVVKNIPSDAIIDYDGFKIKNHESNTEIPLSFVPRDKYQQMNNKVNGTYQIHVGKDNKNKVIEFNYEAIGPDGKPRIITVIKKADENGNVPLPTDNDLVAAGGKGYNWPLVSVKNSDDPKNSVYNPADIDKISNRDLRHTVEQGKDIQHIPVVSDPNNPIDPNAEYEVTYTDADGKEHTVKTKPEKDPNSFGDYIFNVPVPNENGPVTLEKIEKINPEGTRSEIDQFNPKDKFEIENSANETPSFTSKQDPNDKSLTISSKLGPENANKDVILKATDSNGNEILIPGTTDENGNFTATAPADQVRGKVLKVEEIVNANDPNEIIKDFKNLPENKRTINLTNELNPDGTKDNVYNIEPIYPDSNDSNSKPKPNPAKVEIIRKDGTIDLVDTEVDPNNPNIHRIPEDALSEGDKINRVVSASDPTKTLVENKDITDQDRYKHVVPTIEKEISENDDKSETILKDLPNTIKEGEKVVVEFEKKNPETGQPEIIQVPAVVTEDENGNTQIRIDDNDLPKDEKITLTGIYKDKNNSNNSNDEPIKGVNVFDIDNVDDEKEKEKAITTPIHINKIGIESSQITNHTRFDQRQLTITLEDTKNLINYQTNKPKIVLANIKNNTKVVYNKDSDKTKYEINGNVKKLILDIEDLELNNTYYIESIEFDLNTFATNIDQTIGLNQNNIIYDFNNNKVKDKIASIENKLIINDIVYSENNTIDDNGEQLTVTVGFDTNFTEELLTNHKFKIRYKNRTNISDELVSNVNVQTIEIDNDVKKAKFNLVLPKSNRYYDFVDLSITNPSQDLANFETNKNDFKNVELNASLQSDSSKLTVISAKRKTEISKVDLISEDIDHLRITVDLNSQDAAFYKEQDFEITIRKVNDTSVIKTLVTTPFKTINSVDKSRKNGEYKKATVVFEFDGNDASGEKYLEEDTQYEIVSIKMVEKPDFLAHDVRIAADGQNIANTIEYSDEVKAKIAQANSTYLKEFTLNQNSPIVKLLPDTANKEEFDADKLISAAIDVEFKNILRDWKNKKVILEYKSKKFDEIVNFNSTFTANQSNTAKFTIDGTTPLKNNREYELQKIYYIDENLNNNVTINKPILNQGTVNLSFKTKTDANHLTIGALEQLQTNDVKKSKLKFIINDQDDVVAEGDQLEISYILKDKDGTNNSEQVITTNVKEQNNVKYIEFEINDLELNQENIITKVRFSESTPSRATYTDMLTNNSEFTLTENVNFKNEILITQEIQPTETVDANSKSISSNFVLKITKSDHINKDALYFVATYNQKTASDNRAENSIIYTPNFVQITNDNNLNIQFNDLVANRKYHQFKLHVISPESEPNNSIDDNFIQNSMIYVTGDNKTVHNLITRAQTTVAKQETKTNDGSILKLKYELTSEDQILEDGQSVKLELIPTDRTKGYKFVQFANVTKDNNNKFFVEFNFDVSAKDLNWDNEFEVENNKVEEDLSYHVHLKFKNRPSRANDNINVEKISDNINSVLLDSKIHNEGVSPVFDRIITIGAKGIVFDSTFDVIVNNNTLTGENVVENLDKDVQIKWKFSSDITNKIQNKKVKLIFEYPSSKPGEKHQIATDEITLNKNDLNDASKINITKENDKVALTFTIKKELLRKNRQFNFAKIQIIDSLNSQDVKEWNDQVSTAISGSFKVQKSADVTILKAEFVKENTLVEKATFKIIVNDLDDVISPADKDKLKITYDVKNVANSSVTLSKDPNNSQLKVTKIVTLENNQKEIHLEINNHEFNKEYQLQHVEFVSDLVKPAFKLKDNTNILLQATDAPIAIANNTIAVADVKPSANDKTITVNYPLTNDILNVVNGSTKFVAHFKDLENKEFLTDVAELNNNGLLFTLTNGVRFNNRYTLQNIYVADSDAEIKKITINNGVLVIVQDAKVQTISLANVLEDNKSVITRFGTTKAILQNNPVINATSASFDLKFTTEDEIFDNATKVKLTIAKKTDPAWTRFIEVTLTQNSTTEATGVFVFDNLDDDTTYTIEQIQFVEFNKFDATDNIKPIANLLNGNNLVDVIKKTDDSSFTEFVLPELEYNITKIVPKDLNKNQNNEYIYPNNELQNATLNVQFDAIQHKWKNNKVVLVYKANNFDEYIYFENQITNITAAATDLEFVATSDLKTNREYTLEKVFFVDATVNDYDIKDKSTYQEITKKPTASAEVITTFKTDASDNALSIVNFEQMQVNNIKNAKLKFTFDDKDNILTDSDTFVLNYTTTDVANKTSNHNLETNVIIENDKKVLIFEINNQLVVNKDNFVNSITLKTDANKTKPSNAAKDLASNEITIESTLKTAGKVQFKNEVKVTSSRKPEEAILNTQNAKTITASVELDLEVSDHLNISDLNFAATLSQETESDTRAANAQIVSPIAKATVDKKVTLKFNDLVSNRNYINPRIFVSNDASNINVNINEITGNALATNAILPFATSAGFTKAEQLTGNDFVNANGILKLKYEISSEDQILFENINEQVTLTLTPVQNRNYFFSKDALVLKENDKYYVQYEFTVKEKDASWTNGNITSGDIEEGLIYNVELRFVSNPSRAHKSIKVAGINYVPDIDQNNRARTLINFDTINSNNTLKIIDIPGKPFTFEQNLKFKDNNNFVKTVVEYLATDEIQTKLIFDNVVNKIENEEIRLVFTYPGENKGQNLEFATNKIAINNANITEHPSDANANVLAKSITFTIASDDIKNNREYTFARIEIFDSKNQRYIPLTDSFNTSVAGTFKVKPSDNVTVASAEIVASESNINQHKVKITINDPDDIVSTSLAEIANLIVKYNTTDAVEHGNLVTRDLKISKVANSINKEISFVITDVELTKNYQISLIKFIEDAQTQKALLQAAYPINGTNNIIQGSDNFDATKILTIDNQQFTLVEKTPLNYNSNNPNSINGVYTLQNKRIVVANNDTAFRALFIDLAGNKYLSEIVTVNDNDNVDLNVVVNNLRSNNKYTLEAIYVGNEQIINTIDVNQIDSNIKKVDISAIATKEVTIPAAPTTVTLDDAVNNNTIADAKITTNGADFKFTIINPDQLLTDQIKVKVTINKNGKALGTNDHEYQVQLTEVSQDKTSAKIDLTGKVNNLDDEAQYYVSKIEIVDFNLQANGAASEFNGENGNIIVQADVNSTNKITHFTTKAKTFDFVKIQHDDEYASPSNVLVLVAINNIKAKWQGKKLVLVYVDEKFNEEIFFVKENIQLNNANNDLVLTKTNNSTIKSNRKYVLNRIFLADSNVNIDSTSTGIAVSVPATSANIKNSFKVKPSSKVKATNLTELDVNALDQAIIKLNITDSDGVVSTSDQVKVTYVLNGQPEQSTIVNIQEDNGNKFIQVNLNGLTVNSTNTIKSIEFISNNQIAQPAKSVYDVGAGYATNSLTIEGTNEFKNQITIKDISLTNGKFDFNVNNSSADVRLNLDVSKHLKNLKFKASYQQVTASDTRVENQVIETDEVENLGNTISLTFNDLVSNRLYNSFKLMVGMNDLTNAVELVTEQVKANDLAIPAKETTVDLEKTKVNNKLTLKYFIDSPDQIFFDGTTEKVKLTLKEQNGTVKIEKEAQISKDNITNKYYAQFDFDIAFAHLAVNDNLKEGYNYDVTLQFANKPTRLNSNIAVHKITSEQNNENILINTTVNTALNLLEIEGQNITFDSNFEVYSNNNLIANNAKVENLNHDVKIKWKFASDIVSAIINKQVQMVFEYPKAGQANNKIELTSQWITLDPSVLNDANNSTITKDGDKVVLEFTLNKDQLQHNRKYTFKELRIKNLNEADASAMKWTTSVINPDVISGEFQVQASADVTLDSATFVQANTSLEQAEIKLTLTDPDDIISVHDLANITIKYALQSQKNTPNNWKEASANSLINTLNNNSKEITFIINENNTPVFINKDYVITYFAFDKNQATRTIAAESVKQNTIDNVVFGAIANYNPGTQGDVKVINNKLAISQDVALVVQGKKVVANYTLNNQILNSDNKKFIGLFTDLANNKILSNAIVANNGALSFELDGSKTHYNNKYTLQNIYVGDSNTIDQFNDPNQVPDQVALVNLDVLTNKDAIVNFSATTAKLTKETNYQDQSIGTNDAKLSIQFNTNDDVFAHDVAVKITIAQKDDSSVTHKTSVNLDGGSLSSVTKEFIFDNLKDDTTYIIKEIKFDNFDPNAKHTLNKINGNNLIATLKTHDNSADFVEFTTDIKNFDITKIIPQNTNIENNEHVWANNQLTQNQIKVALSAIQNKWKGQKLFLEFKAEHFDGETVYFEQEINQNSIAGEYDFTLVNGYTLKANRKYNLEKVFVGLGTNLDSEANDNNNLVKNANALTSSVDIVTSFRTQESDSPIVITNMEQLKVLDLKNSKLKFIINDKDDVLATKTATESGDKVKLVAKIAQPSLNSNPIQKEFIGEVEIDDKANKYVIFEINNQIVLNKDNIVEALEFNPEANKIKPTKAAANLNSNSFDVSAIKNNNSNLFGNKVEVDTRGVQPFGAQNDNNIFTSINLNLNISDHLDLDSLWFAAEMQQKSASNARLENAKINSNTVKATQTGKIKTVNFKFIDLVSNRQYDNFRIFVSQQNPTQASIENEILAPGSVLPFNTEAGITQAEQFYDVNNINNANSDFINTKQTLKVKYEISSEDQILFENMNEQAILTLTPVQTRSYYFSKQVPIVKTGDKFFAEFNFDVHEFDDTWSGNVTNGQIEEGLSYNVELSLNRNPLRAHKSIKVNGINYVADIDPNNPKRILINDETLNKAKTMKIITIPGQDLNFASGLQFKDSNGNWVDWAEYNATNGKLADANVEVGLAFDKLTNAIKDQKLKLVFEYQKTMNSKEIVESEETQLTSANTSNKLVINGKNYQFASFMIPQALLKANREYSLKRIEIQNSNGNWTEFTGYLNNNISGNFSIKPSESVQLLSAEFVKDESNTLANKVALKVKDIDDVISFADLAQLDIKYALKSTTSDYANWLIGSNPSVMEDKADKANKIITFTINSPNISQDYTINYLEFQKAVTFPNKALIQAAYPINVTDNNDVIFGQKTYDANKTKDITNSILKVKNALANDNIAWNNNVLTVQYELENERINTSGHKFKAVFKDLANVELFSDAVDLSADNKLTFTINNARSNNKYTLDKIYVGSESEIDNFTALSNLGNSNISTDSIKDLAVDANLEKAIEVPAQSTTISLTNGTNNVVNASDINNYDATLHFTLNNPDGLLQPNQTVQFTFTKVSDNSTITKDITLTDVMIVNGKSANITVMPNNLDDGTEYFVSKVHFTNFNKNTVHALQNINNDNNNVIATTDANNKNAIASFTTVFIPIIFDKDFKLKVGTTEKTNKHINGSLSTINEPILIEWEFTPEIPNALKDKKVQMVFEYIDLASATGKSEITTSFVSLNTNSKISQSNNKTKVIFDIDKNILKGGRKYTFKELRIKNSDDTGKKIWIDNSPNNQSNTTLKTRFFSTSLTSPIQIKRNGSTYRYRFVPEESGIINVVGEIIVQDEDDLISNQDLENLVITWMPLNQYIKIRGNVSQISNVANQRFINKASGANFVLQNHPNEAKTKIIKFNFDASDISLFSSIYEELPNNLGRQVDGAAIIKVRFIKKLAQLNDPNGLNIFFFPNFANITNINRSSFFAIHENKFPELVTNNNAKKITTKIAYITDKAVLKPEDWYVAYFKDLRGNYRYKKFQLQPDNSLNTSEGQIGSFNLEIDNIIESNNKYFFEGVFGGTETTIDQIINELENNASTFNPNNYKRRHYGAKHIFKSLITANFGTNFAIGGTFISNPAGSLLSQDQREVQINASNTSLATTIDNITNNSARAKFVFNNTDEAFKYLNSDLDAELKIQLGKVSDNSNFGVEQTIVLNNTNTVVTQNGNNLEINNITFDNLVDGTEYFIKKIQLLATATNNNKPIINSQFKLNHNSVDSSTWNILETTNNNKDVIASFNIPNKDVSIDSLNYQNTEANSQNIFANTTFGTGSVQPIAKINFADSLPSRLTDKKLVLVYTSDQNEKVIFTKTITANDLAAGQKELTLANGSLKGNRIYNFSNLYYVNANELIDPNNIDLTNKEDLTGKIANDAAFVKEFKTRPSDNAIAITNIAEQEVNTLDKSKLKITISDLDNVLVVGDTIKVTYSKDNAPALSKNGTVALENGEKVVILEIDRVALNKINMVTKIELDASKLSQLTFNPLTNNQITIAANVNKEFKNILELKNDGNIYTPVVSTANANNINAKVNNVKFIISSHLKPTNIYFMAQTTQETSSDNPARIANAFVNSTKVQATRNNDELTVTDLTFEQLVFNRKYKNIKVFVDIQNATDFTAQDNEIATNQKIVDFTVEPGTTSATQVANSSSIDVNANNGKGLVKLVYSLASQDQFLKPGTPIILELIQTGNQTNYKFSKTATIGANGSEVEFIFNDIVDTPEASWNANTFVTNGKLQAGKLYNLTLKLQNPPHKSNPKLTNAPIKVASITTNPNENGILLESNFNIPSRGFVFQDFSYVNNISEFNVGTNPEINLNFSAITNNINNKQIRLVAQYQNPDGTNVQIESEATIVTNASTAQKFIFKQNLPSNRILTIQRAEINENNIWTTLTDKDGLSDLASKNNSTLKIKSKGPILVNSAQFTKQSDASIDKVYVLINVSDPDNLIDSNKPQSLSVKLSNSAGNNDIATTINSITNSGQIMLSFTNAEFGKDYKLSQLKFTAKPNIAPYDVEFKDNTNKVLSNSPIANGQSIGNITIESIDSIDHNFDGSNLSIEHTFVSNALANFNNLTFDSVIKDLSTRIHSATASGTNSANVLFNYPYNLIQSGNLIRPFNNTIKFDNIIASHVNNNMNSTLISLSNHEIIIDPSDTSIETVGIDYSGIGDVNVDINIFNNDGLLETIENTPDDVFLVKIKSNTGDQQEAHGKLVAPVQTGFGKFRTQVAFKNLNIGDNYFVEKVSILPQWNAQFKNINKALKDVKEYTTTDANAVVRFTPIDTRTKILNIKPLTLRKYGQNNTETSNVIDLYQHESATFSVDLSQINQNDIGKNLRIWFKDPIRNIVKSFISNETIINNKLRDYTFNIKNVDSFYHERKITGYNLILADTVPSFGITPHKIAANLLANYKNSEIAIDNSAKNYNFSVQDSVGQIVFTREVANGKRYYIIRNGVKDLLADAKTGIGFYEHANQTSTPQNGSENGYWWDTYDESFKPWTPSRYPDLIGKVTPDDLVSNVPEGEPKYRNDFDSGKIKYIYLYKTDTDKYLSSIYNVNNSNLFNGNQNTLLDRGNTYYEISFVRGGIDIPKINQN